MSIKRVRKFLKRLVALSAAAMMALLLAEPALAQTTFGTLSNFDCFNDTGQETHGFEIELDGISSADVTFKFGAPFERYGDPQLVDFAGGVFVRYESTFVNNAFTQATPLAPSPITPTLGHACWTGGSGNYLTAGCEHFGVGLTKNPTATVYRWLIADPAIPGNLIRSGTKISIPAATWNVNPQPVAPPMVEAVIPAEPPEANLEFGDAQWVKVYKTEAPDHVELQHLVTDDPVVPHEAAEVETEWTLLQMDSKNPNAARNDLANGGELGAGNKSVTRRYEFFKYTGTYDPENHEAKPKVGDGSPQPDEIGDYEGAQMAAVNIGPAAATPTATVTATATATVGPTIAPTATATATPLPGQLSAPAKINFGNAVYGGLLTQGQPVTKLASIGNKSKTATAPIDATATDDFAVIGNGAQGCTAELVSKGKCKIEIKFQPTEFGPRTGKLVIGGIEISTLSGTGVHGKITASPGGLNFGKVGVGTAPITKPVTLTNKSTVAIEVSDFEITDDTADFSVDKSCIGALQTTCQVMVTFAPQTAGKKSAKLNISDLAAGSRTIKLTGAGF